MPNILPRVMACGTPTRQDGCRARTAKSPTLSTTTWDSVIGGARAVAESEFDRCKLASVTLWPGQIGPGPGPATGPPEERRWVGPDSDGRGSVGRLAGPSGREGCVAARRRRARAKVD